MAVLGARWPLPESDGLRFSLIAVSIVVAVAAVFLVERSYRLVPAASPSPIR
jgi:hypothetical protein